jgi:hypothetical protein
VGEEKSVALDRVALDVEETILIEYLDGELSLQERQRVEERLAKEPEFREKLNRLEESWNNLDLLEREEPDHESVESTLETVVFSTEQSIAEIQTHAKRWAFRNSILTVLLFVTIFCFAFLVGGHLASDQYFLLRAAAPIINRLDMYLTLLDDDPELLRLLTERRLFLPPLPEEAEPINPNEYQPSSSVRILDSLTLYPSFAELKRRAKEIENLDESLYARFYNNYKKFCDFPKIKKQKLKEIYENIERSPRRYELFQTLQNYYDWRKTLQSYEKTELRRPFSAVERVEQITALKRHLDANSSEKSVAPPLLSEILKSNESANLAKVLDELPMREKELLLNMPPAQMIAVLQQLSEE